ncbi:multidrug effflux MFS transporter [Parasphingopyxis marina]|uniref:Multidrug effflux MFS transporter n=1 Tax=Parasphingopyxis marina TaxID=2761622 RepID=A0A842HX09_9SPHN|nr:multidrug effflux MFS transporter [Parasphingopyxis marina]MBC2776480.1 multidrug effflux MFS transporter [Parasphingopyxis marina]
MTDTQGATGPSEQLGFREFVAMMAAMMALIALAIDAMLPALPDIGQSLAVTDDNERQWIIAIFMMGFGVTQLIYGTLSDRFGRKRVLLTGVALYIVFSVVCALAPTFELLLISRFLAGAALAVSRVLVISIVRDCFVGRHMARVMSLVFIVFMGAPVLAPAIGQIILFFAPWRWIFGMLAIAGSAVFVWVALRLPETLAVEDRLPLSFARVAQNWKRALTERYSLGYTLGFTMFQGALVGFITSAQQIFFEVFDAELLFTPVFAMVAGAMALANWQNSRLVIRLGTRFLAHWALIGFIGFAAIHLAFAMSGYETIYSFAILQALTMGCFGLASSNFGAMAMNNMGHIAGSAASVQGFVATVFGSLIGISIGQSYDGTTVPMIGGFLTCGLLALAIVFFTEKGKLFGDTVDPDLG